MAKKASPECMELKDIPRDIGPYDQATDIAIKSQRCARLLQILAPMVSLVRSGEHVQIRIEPVTEGLESFGDDDIAAIRERFAKVNSAIRNGDIGISPGLSSVELINREAALNALVPGLFTAKTLQCGSVSQGMGFFSVLGGQWFPPGITLELTARETADLIAILALGSLAALDAALQSFGLAAEIALPLAIALLASAGVVKACQALSATGQCGFKITMMPFPTILPYPV